jgi:hypothetical protein
MTLKVTVLLQVIEGAGTQLHTSINSEIDGGEWAASSPGHTVVAKRTPKVHLVGD